MMTAITYAFLSEIIISTCLHLTKDHKKQPIKNNTTSLYAYKHFHTLADFRNPTVYIHDPLLPHTNPKIDHKSIRQRRGHIQYVMDWQLAMHIVHLHIQIGLNWKSVNFPKDRKKLIEQFITKWLFRRCWCHHTNKQQNYNKESNHFNCFRNKNIDGRFHVSLLSHTIRECIIIGLQFRKIIIISVYQETQTTFSYFYLLFTWISRLTLARPYVHERE